MAGISPERAVERELCERLIKNFMDIIVLKELEKGVPLGGYDLITSIHKRFQILISSGTVYSALYSMERDGLIKGAVSSRKRTYRLTEKGRERLEKISERSDGILLFVRTLLGK